MTRTDKLFGYLIFGFIIFIACFCLGWWIGYLLDMNVDVVIIGSITGMLIGLILDTIFLKRIVDNMYKIKYYWLIILYLIYSFGTLGFFMGVPVFNIFFGLLAGYYIGRRLSIEKSNYKIFLKKLSITNYICLSILLVVCIASASLALADPSTGNNIKGMLNLNFNVTNNMIWGIIIIGGLSLLVIQYFLTDITAKKIYKK